MGRAGAHALPHLLRRLEIQVHSHILEGSWFSVLDRQGFQEEPEVTGFCPEGAETLKRMTRARHGPNCVSVPIAGQRPRRPNGGGAICCTAWILSPHTAQPPDPMNTPANDSVSKPPRRRGSPDGEVGATLDSEVPGLRSSWRGLPRGPYHARGSAAGFGLNKELGCGEAGPAVGEVISLSPSLRSTHFSPCPLLSTHAAPPTAASAAAAATAAVSASAAASRRRWVSSPRLACA